MKRGRDNQEEEPSKRIRGASSALSDDDSSDIEFEDDFDDEYEEEDIIENEDEDEDEDDEDDDGTTDDAGVKFKALDIQDDEDEEIEKDAPKQIWRKELRPMEEDEILVHDPSAYDCFHAMNVTWPCLSFDIIPDKLGAATRKYPHTMYLAAGSQAATADKNCVIFMKISNIQRTKEKEEEEDSGSEEDLEEDDPQGDNPEIESVHMSVNGDVNKLKLMPQQQGGKMFMAAWIDSGIPKVTIYDIQQHVKHLDVPGTLVSKDSNKEYMSIVHPLEGFALDWNPISAGRLLTGDCKGTIFETNVFTQNIVADGYKGHTASVEDLQWSPTEENVFISCSADKTIKVWDARADKRKAMISVLAHEADVNVLSWNKKVSYLIASGSDDCSFSIWDLRKFNKDSDVGHFAYHDKPICSLDWNPHDETQIVVASEDNSITVWDMSLEPDEGDEYTEEFPPQLYFVHQGQKEIKEVKWHPRIMNMIISTASQGFNVFKTINAAEAEMEALRSK
eukprot:TRINITY_DN1466_c0_g1_i1.p1 TRINITY_DN1466_c0_g1~~TRINITY_DN1466_c0_g1_i1.p1  ORF type:complete len:506 (+),score=155.49 TRINITY_DN1466_c0_g1_i1:95-1612(+)